MILKAYFLRRGRRSFSFQTKKNRLVPAIYYVLPNPLSLDSNVFLDRCQRVAVFVTPTSLSTRMS